MVNVKLKDTSINITCDNYEDLYSLYFLLGGKYTFIVNDEVELKRTGRVENNNEHIDEWFAGYSRDWFKKKFFS